jgi:hypothetical protein
MTEVRSLIALTVALVVTTLAWLLLAPPGHDRPSLAEGPGAGLTGVGWWRPASGEARMVLYAPRRVTVDADGCRVRTGRRLDGRLAWRVVRDDGRPVRVPATGRTLSPPQGRYVVDLVERVDGYDVAVSNSVTVSC